MNGDDIVVTLAPDGALSARTTFEACGCEVEVQYRDGGEPGAYRCSCEHELILGPGAPSLLSVGGTAVAGSRSVEVPGGAPIEVAWRIRS